MNFQRDNLGRYVAFFGSVEVRVQQRLYQPRVRWGIILDWHVRGSHWKFEDRRNWDSAEEAMAVAQEFVPGLIKDTVDQASQAILENVPGPDTGPSSWERLFTETFP